MKTSWIRAMISLLLVVAVAACSDDENGNNGTNNGANNGESDVGDASNNGGTDTGGEDMGGDAGTDTGEEDTGPIVEDLTCDPLNDGHCAFPWPSNLYMKEDTERTTGYTLKFEEGTLGATKMGTKVDPAPFERMDGYGLGSSLLALFPNLDASEMNDEYNVADSVAADAPVVWLELDDQNEVVRKIPYWVDHDLNTDDKSMRTLFVHPAVILKEDTRYVAAFRNLKDTDGNPIPRSDAFQALLDGDTADNPNLDFRQARFDEIFQILEDEGVSRDSLTLAWDFRTASSDALHGRMLHMRDEALTDMPDGPEMTIVEENVYTETEDEYVAVELRGKITVPNYMKELPHPNSGLELGQFNLGNDGMPEQNGTRTINFWVTIPHTALDGTAHDVALYGHGLFGSGRRAWASFNRKIAYDHNVIVYGADLKGMSSPDEIGGLAASQDSNYFPTISDQLHQGMLEWLLLTRAMLKRFPNLTEVTDRSLNINTDEAFYFGNSQGGIFGPTFVALSEDCHHGQFGVPGHNYSVILHRSVDFEEFFDLVKMAYPDPAQQAILISAWQLLWNGTDSVSYVRKIADDPFPGQTMNYGIWGPAKGDHQVTVIQNEVLVRSDIGIDLMENYDDERTVGLASPVSYPHSGSGVVLYDFGNEWPVPGNLPPVRDVPTSCSQDCEHGCHGDGECAMEDPHEFPRRSDWHNEQMAHFWRNAEIIDVCGGDGCHPD